MKDDFDLFWGWGRSFGNHSNAQSQNQCRKFYDCVFHREPLQHELARMLEQVKKCSTKLFTSQEKGLVGGRGLLFGLTGRTPGVGVAGEGAFLLECAVEVVDADRAALAAEGGAEGAAVGGFGFRARKKRVARSAPRSCRTHFSISLSWSRSNCRNSIICLLCQCLETAASLGPGFRLCVLGVWFCRVSYSRAAEPSGMFERLMLH